MNEVQSTQFESDDEGLCTPSPMDSKSEKLSPLRVLKSDVMKGNETDYGDFVLDRTESINIDNDEIAILHSTPVTELSSKWKEKIYSEMLTSDEYEDGNQAAKNGTQKKPPVCFNCDGEHHFAECVEPKDMRRIRKRQIELRNSRNNSSRYHNEMEPSEKKFRAGRISDELRKALGIGRNDIPEYIYRMRKMGFIDGYPPGYLKKAIERDDSNEVLQFHMVDDKMSSTGVVERPDSPPPKINAGKMIYYCGFNQYYRDLRDLENFRVPPFLEFVAFHQETINKAHAKKLQERRRNREREIRTAMRRRTKLAEDEVVILEPSPPPSCSNSGDDDVVIIDCDSMKTPSRSATSPNTPKGSSIGVIMGTPVLTRRRFDDEADMTEDAKPSLDNFSKGIVPFEAHEEYTPHKGFLKKIMSKIKRLTG